LDVIGGFYYSGQESTKSTSLPYIGDVDADSFDLITKSESCKCEEKSIIEQRALAKWNSALNKDLDETRKKAAKYQNLYSEAKCKNIAFEKKMSLQKIVIKTQEAEKTNYTVKLNRKLYRIKELKGRLLLPVEKCRKKSTDGATDPFPCTAADIGIILNPNIKSVPENTPTQAAEVNNVDHTINSQAEQIRMYNARNPRHMRLQNVSPRVIALRHPNSNAAKTKKRKRRSNLPYKKSPLSEEVRCDNSYPQSGISRLNITF
jgi:hypothetical protein